MAVMVMTAKAKPDREARSVVGVTVAIAIAVRRAERARIYAAEDPAVVVTPPAVMMMPAEEPRMMMMPIYDAVMVLRLMRNHRVPVRPRTPMLGVGLWHKPGEHQESYESDNEFVHLFRLRF